MTDAYPKLRSYQRTAMIVGIVGVVFALIGAFFGLASFFQAYLFSFFFWFGLSLGSLMFLMVGHIAGGSWAAMVRPVLEAATQVLPIMALLFVPLLFGMPVLYEWTNPEYVASHPLVAAKTAYLNVPFFIIRAAFFFTVWIVLMMLFNRFSALQAKGDRPDLQDRMRGLAAPGIILYILTMTFAAFDWGMSLDAEWFSGIYGVIFMIGQVISSVALCIVMMVTLGQKDPINSVLTEKRLQDLGNFMMAFAMFWAYVSVSQLIIIWSNNIVETNSWYVVRFGNWAFLGIFLALFHFVVPFLVLFSRWVKRQRRALIIVAFWMLFMRLVDLFWFLKPSFPNTGVNFGTLTMDVVLLLAIGGIWFFFFLGRLGKRPILPPHDTRLVSSDAHGHGIPAASMKGGAEHA